MDYNNEFSAKVSKATRALELAMPAANFNFIP